MNILFSAEENSGGGAISNYNLAVASTSFSNVAFLGIKYEFTNNDKIIYFESNTKNAISLKYFYNYWKAIKEFNPEIIHSTGMYTGLVAIFLRYMTKRKYKIIMTLRHSFTTFRYDFIAKRVINFLSRVDIIHYLSEYQMNIYRDLGLIPKKYCIIPNIINKESYSVDEVKSLSDKIRSEISADWLIVFIGRLVESKQLDVFIKTIKILDQDGFNVGGVIVGEGNIGYQERLVELTKEISVNSKIIFTGFVKKPLLYVKACDFGLFPTLGEALPRFVIESFSQEKTLVISNHPSLSKIIHDKEDALVVENHSPEDYAKKCIQLIADPLLLKQLEVGAGSTYNHCYNSDFVCEEYRKMYYKILS